jgi:hypothetical protein
MSAIPMPSARLGNGRYEVIGTSHNVEVRRHRREWWLVLDGDPDARIGPFKTKRAALSFCQGSSEL